MKNVFIPPFQAHWIGANSSSQKFLNLHSCRPFVGLAAVVMLIVFVGGCRSTSTSQPKHKINAEYINSTSATIFITDERVAPGTGFTLCYKKKANICAMCATGPQKNCVGGINVNGDPTSNTSLYSMNNLTPNTTYRVLVKNINGVRVGQVEEFTTLP